jgi:hypothetical protein
VVPEPGGELVDRRLIDVCNDDPGALRDEQPRRRGADAPRPTRDHGDLASQTVHPRPSLQFCLTFWRDYLRVTRRDEAASASISLLLRSRLRVLEIQKTPFGVSQETSRRRPPFV